MIAQIFLACFLSVLSALIVGASVFWIAEMVIDIFDNEL